MIKKLFLTTLFILSLTSQIFAFTPPTENYIADSYTKLLVHGDQADGTAGTDILDSETTPKTITAVGNAQVDTAQYKNLIGSTGSILFDGNGDYLSLVDSDDFYILNGLNTTDFWIRWNSVTNCGFVQQYIDANNEWIIGYDTTIGLRIYQWESAGYKGHYYCSWTPSTNTWYHIAFTWDGTTQRIFIDGVAQSVTVGAAWNSPVNLGATLQIGKSTTNGDFNGWIDELRISKGIARDWIIRRVINIAYGIDIGQIDRIGTPLWSCKIKLECFWRNLCG